MKGHIYNMNSKNLFKRALGFAAVAMISAGLAISVCGANAAEDLNSTSAAAISSAAGYTVNAMAAASNNVVLHIEQQVITLDDLVESDYQVNVRIYSTGAQRGIDSWNSKFLCYADCTPSGYDEIYTASMVLCGDTMSLDKKTGINSDNFNITVGALTNNPVGVVQVSGYSSETVYNDNLTDTVGEVTLYTLTFTLPKTACDGDVFSIIWWDEKNSENRNGIVAADSEAYNTYYEHGFIMVVSDSYTPDDECIGISCEDGYLGSFYADDKNTLALSSPCVQATLFDGGVVDISDDCVLKAETSPYELYWDAYGSGNPTFNYSLDIIYCGNDNNIVAYCEKYGYTVGSVGLTIGQRGDVDLDHTANNFDTAEITKYIADMQVYETAVSFGQPAVMPLLCNGNNLSVFLADCSGDGDITTQDAAALTQWEALVARYSIMQSLAGTPADAQELCALWEQILNAD